MEQYKTPGRLEYILSLYIAQACYQAYMALSSRIHQQSISMGLSKSCVVEHAIWRFASCGMLNNTTFIVYHGTANTFVSRAYQVSE